MPQTPAHAPSEASLDRMMHSPARAVPVTVALIATNLLVFGLMARLQWAPWSLSHADPLAWGANFGPATQDDQWWRLLSAAFVHFGWVHVGVNMWALWDVGRLLEGVLGRWRYALLYLGAGAVGNLLSLAVQGNVRVTGGASGAIFGLYGALIVFLWRERRQIDPDEFRWLFTVAIAFSGLMLALGFFIPAIDNAAHAGGFLAGALLGSLLVRPWLPASPLARQQAPWAAALSVLGLLAMAASISPPRYHYQEELQARAAIQRFTLAEGARMARWDAILKAGDHAGAPIDQLATALEREVAASYERAFYQLASANPTSPIPSKDALQQLETYASQRSKAARQLAQSLRVRKRGGSTRPHQQAMHPV